MTALETIAAARESSRSGRAIDLTTTFAEPPLPDATIAPAAHLVHDRTRCSPPEAA